MATYLQRTESAGNRKTFTWSAWVKLGNATATKFLAACSYSSSDESYFMINSSAQLGWESSTSSDGTVRTNRLFRDINGWYHIVLAVDTTQATDSNRIKFYVNGVQETSMSTATYPAQDRQLYWNVGGTYYPRIGKRHASGNEWDGSMSHVVHIDGTQELPTIFGETDSTTGEWKIKTSITPSSGWGTNGYHILKDGNSVTDQSGQGNNWSVGGGTLTKTEDNPSNVFATNNSLWKQESSRYLTHTKGNTQIKGQGAFTWYQTPGTLAFNSGKFYWECKWNASSNLTQNHAGVIDYDKTMETGLFRSKTGSVFFTNEDGGEMHIDGPATSADYGTIAQNDILGVAVDMDATTPTVKFYKNGSLHASTNAASLAGKFVTPAQMVYEDGEFQLNFGNGYFGTTAVSSNSGSGYSATGSLGIFQYQPPTGYTALSTKGLNL